MTGHRAEKVGDVVREVLSRVLREELRDPRVGFVTITDVRVSPDLRHARVFVSKLGPAAEREAAVAALKRAAPFLRRALAEHAGLRRTPDLQFVGDATLETGDRVERLLDDLEKQRPPEAGTDAPEDGDA
jgi:ribosome-binding factor A